VSATQQRTEVSSSEARTLRTQASSILCCSSFGHIWAFHVRTTPSYSFLPQGTWRGRVLRIGFANHGSGIACEPGAPVICGKKTLPFQTAPAAADGASGKAAAAAAEPGEG